MEFSDLMTYFSMGVVVLWTMRMTRSRSQNPWLWGGASILLMMASGLLNVPSPILLGMAPMAFLLFFRRAPQAPTVSSEDRIPEDRVICPKCQAYHATGHNFCVNCGWQLDQPYAPEGAAPEGFTKVEQPEVEQPVAPNPRPRRHVRTTSKAPTAFSAHAARTSRALRRRPAPRLRRHTARAPPRDESRTHVVRHATNL